MVLWTSVTRNGRSLTASLSFFGGVCAVCCAMDVKAGLQTGYSDRCQDRGFHCFERGTARCVELQLQSE